jgi:hypothetical protein
MKNVCESKSNRAQRWACNRTAEWYKTCVKHWLANKATDGP